ncbi:PDZ domain-containing protein [Arthrobacter sp. JZ12]|uniref:S1C family serine protease n=1 Tax=Arthrobacter sp. JZ12 TaxID=2654190 RepID=UPI002B458D08|nr:trypsin-like peptidase domain-containing protein [Arthrobacter sp. JZ12]WRH25430.1 PDZ domain-containing protein [Arthrobacter sp. JZ12]
MTENNPGSYNGPLPPRPQNPPSPRWGEDHPLYPRTEQQPALPHEAQAQATQHAEAHRETEHYGNGAFGYGPHHQQPENIQGGKAKERVGTGTFIAGMLVAGLIGGGVVAGADALLESGGGGANGGAAQAESVVVNDTESVNEITGAAAKASPSVVTISVSGAGSGGSGSGIILDAEGHILTNTHVVTLGGQVADPAVEVKTNDGRVFQAQVVGTDPLSDLAVIKIDAPDLQPATLADSSELNVGDVAIAIGAPLGLSGTVTDGIISTLNRTIAVQSSAVPEQQSDAPEQEPGEGFNFLPPDGSQAPEQSAQGSIFLNVIQTDAAINQGNSGGALVDSQGRIIGVNVAIASAGSGESAGNIGVGFSIPINYAQRVANEIIANGEATHGFLGVSVGAAASGGEEASASSFSVGAEVQSIEGGSPAETAGIQEGDVITKVGELVIDDPQALTAAVRMLAEGETTTVELLRGGETLTLDVTVGQAPA